MLLSNANEKWKSYECKRLGRGGGELKANRECCILSKSVLLPTKKKKTSMKGLAFIMMAEVLAAVE